MQPTKENYKISQKAWGLNWVKVEQGDYYRGNIKCVYAENASKAKSLLLKEAQEYRLQNGDEINFINMPVIREKQADRFDFEGQDLGMLEIGQILSKRQNAKKYAEIQSNPDITHCLILKRGLYYCPNYNGYTESYFGAGVYTKEEAIIEANCDGVSIIAINTTEHNQKILRKIEDLKSKLL